MWIHPANGELPRPCLGSLLSLLWIWAGISKWLLAVLEEQVTSVKYFSIFQNNCLWDTCAGMLVYQPRTIWFIVSVFICSPAELRVYGTIPAQNICSGQAACLNSGPACPLRSFDKWFSACCLLSSHFTSSHLGEENPPLSSQAASSLSCGAWGCPVCPGCCWCVESPGNPAAPGEEVPWCPAETYPAGFPAPALGCPWSCLSLLGDVKKASATPQLWGVLSLPAELRALLLVLTLGQVQPC